MRWRLSNYLKRFTALSALEPKYLALAGDSAVGHGAGFYGLAKTASYQVEGGNLPNAEAGVD